MKKVGLFVLLTAGLLTQAQAGGWNGDAVLGGALGGAAGAAIGSNLGGRDGAIVGGLLGGAVGVAVASNHFYPREQVVIQRRYVPAHQAYRPVPRGYADGYYRAHGYVPPAHVYSHDPRGYRPHYGY